MKIKNKYGIIQIVLSYLVLWIPEILKIILKEFNKDIFFICLILSCFIMVDARMKYNSIYVKINYWIFVWLFIFHFIVLIF